MAWQLECIQTLEGHTDRVWHLAWSPDGNALASCSSDRVVRIWQKSQVPGKGWRCTVLLEDTHSKSIRCCCWSPGGTHLASASFDGTTSIWAVQQGVWEEVSKLEGHENEVKSVAWSPCGNYLATCGRDRTVWFWERGLGEEYDCMDVKHGHSQDVKCVAWHPTRELLASCSYDDSIRLWVCDEGDWVCAAVLEGAAVGHSSTVWCVAFSRDGRRLASVSDDQTLRVWDLSWASSADTSPSCKLAATLSGHHSRTIYSVDWSAEGLLATGDGSNAIKVFGQPDCLEAAAAPPPPPSGADTPTETAAEDHTGMHNGLSAPNPQEQQDTAATPGAAWEQLCSAGAAHTADVNCVRWHPTDPTLLASASDDGVIKLWRLHKPKHLTSAAH